MRKTIIFLLLSTVGALYAFTHYTDAKPVFVSHEVDVAKTNLRFYLDDDKGNKIGSLGRLKSLVESRSETLLFAVNGGMYLKDQSPQGLYIEDGETLKGLDTRKSSYGNFYMQPNGVFYLTEEGGTVVQTAEFRASENIRYATQSGPMLLIDGKMHPKFKKGSKHVNIRNGVGILPNGNVLFAISNEKVCFYDFAAFFESKGCKNALYLDGYVSKAYQPQANLNQTGGHFGVMIGESN